MLSGVLNCAYLQGNNPEDRMPAWARKQTRSEAGPGPGSNASSNPSGRRRASSIQSTTGTAVGGRLPAVTRGESMTRRAGAIGSGGAGAAAGAAGGGAAGKQAAGMKKTEYMGPDGDLVANLERDVLDCSPGIRWVIRQLCCHCAGARLHVGLAQQAAACLPIRGQGRSTQLFSAKVWCSWDSSSPTSRAAPAAAQQRVIQATEQQLAIQNCLRISCDHALHTAAGGRTLLA